MSGEHEPLGPVLAKAAQAPARRRIQRGVVLEDEEGARVLRRVLWGMLALVIVLLFVFGAYPVAVMATILALVLPPIYRARARNSRRYQRRHGMAIASFREALTAVVIAEMNARRIGGVAPSSSEPSASSTTAAQEALAALDLGDQASALARANDVVRNGEGDSPAVLPPPLLERVSKTATRLRRARMGCGQMSCKDPMRHQPLQPKSTAPVFSATSTYSVQDRPHAGPTNGPELGAAAGRRAPIAATSPSPNPCDSTLATARS